jgi:hypothetical protein
MSDLGNEARRFVRGQHNGVLSTLSRRLEGYPFGSVTPFICDHAGRPVILISTLAEHTRNIDADPRVSLIVQPFSEDMQEVARLTLIGQARRLEDKEGLGPRYLRQFPKAEAYFAMHDFHFYRIEPVRIRYIGGIGKIHWLEPSAYLCDPGSLPESEAGILAHMNRDHRDSLSDYCRHFLDIEGTGAELIGIDPDGMDLHLAGRTCRIDFPGPAIDAASARAVLVAMAKECQT